MLLEKKAQYQNGELEKDQYYKEMFEIHKYLFEYPELIKSSPVKKIEITAEQVIFTISSGCKNIMLCCDARDVHSLPMTFLNIQTYETAEMNVILKIIKSGDVVFDIGANIGWYTLSVLFKHPGTAVYSFEPIESSCEYLKKNLELNGQDTDKIFNFGFSDENKMIKFYFDINYAMASSMVNLKESNTAVGEECIVKRLDDFVSSLPSLNKIDFIKCDVEGAEFFVFKGAIETIKKYKPIIFSEMLRKWAKKFDYHPNDIIKLFSDINYDCYVINNNKIEKFGYVDEETMQTNYLFFHKEKHADIVRRLL